MTNLVIEVKDFCKSYGKHVGVDAISFDVRDGEIFGLLGPNGAGKTSTLECLEGLRMPSGGSLQVAGEISWTCHRDFERRSEARAARRVSRQS